MKLIGTLLLVLCSLRCLAQPADIVVTELAKDVYLLKSVSYGTNIGLLKTDQAVVLIDPMPGESQLLALNHSILQLTSTPVTLILNTHNHADHTGGNAFFTARGARLVTDAAWQQVSEATGITALVAKSHSASDTIFFHRASNSIFVGDVFDSSWHPTFYAGGVAGFNAAIDAILQIGDEQSRIIPGHGLVKGKAELRAFRAHSMQWLARVRQLHKAGLSAQAMQQDAELMAILQRFNFEQKADFLPAKAVLRFIERTITLVAQERQPEVTIQ